MSHPTLRPNARTTTRTEFQPGPNATNHREASLPAGSAVHAVRTTEGWDLWAWVDATADEAPDYVRANAHRFEYLLNGKEASRA